MRPGKQHLTKYCFGCAPWPGQTPPGGTPWGAQAGGQHRRRLSALLIITLAAAGLFVRTPSPALAAGDTYTVQTGDTLTGIARQHGTTVESLVEANRAKYPCLAANPTCLQAGWTLAVPGARVAPASGQTTPSTYLVQAGDTLTRIAARFGTTVDAILKANGLADANTLYVDQTLALPAGAAPVPQQPNVSALATRIHGTPEFVAAVEAALAWLAEHDPSAGSGQAQAALTRVRDCVDAISVETRPGFGGRAYATNKGAWCEVNLIQDDLMDMVATLYHEASHCYQWGTQGYVERAAGEAFAYGEQADFMRRHGHNPRLIALFEQGRDHYAAEAGLN